MIKFVPTAGWVRPKFVEKLLHDGLRGVLIVRAARAEAAARDGNRWVAARFSGERKPAFRPQRAGAGQWRIADYTPGDERSLRAVADELRGGTASAVRTRSKVTSVAALIAITLLVMAAVVAPSHLRVQNPAPVSPELVFAFKVFGEMQAVDALDPVEEAKKPVHMRGRVTEKPQRQPVTVRLTVDGIATERIFRAKGLTDDGPAIDEWRQNLAPGKHDIVIEMLRGAGSEPLHWSGVIEAQNRRLHVITYQPADGFRLE